MKLTANHVAMVPFDLFMKNKRMNEAYLFDEGNKYLLRTFADVYADVYFAAEEEFRREVCVEPTGGEEWDNRVKGLLDK